MIVDSDSSLNNIVYSLDKSYQLVYISVWTIIWLLINKIFGLYSNFKQYNTNTNIDKLKYMEINKDINK